MASVKRDWVTMLFDENERENWATGGELHKFGQGFGNAGSGDE
jgi:4-oxalocrotonate tautomerase